MKLTDQQIYDTIMGLIEQKGPKFTTEDLAKKLHTSKRTIYQRFSNKEELISQMIDFLFTDIAQKAACLKNDPELSAYEKIEKYVRDFPSTYQIGYILRYSKEIAQRYPKQWDKFNRKVNEISSTFYRILINDPNTRKLTITEKKLLALMLQKAMQILLNGDFLRQHQLDFWDAVTAMYRILFHGIFKPKTIK